jgi:molybdate transport system substrate-binding protein
MSNRLVFFPWILAAVIGCGRAEEPVTPAQPAAPVKVFAAASTKTAMEAIAADFRAATGIPVDCETAASSTLARQIENGAGADLFLSADEEWADYLEKKKLVAQRRPLLTNRLVVVVPAHSNLAVKELADVAGDAVKRLAIAAEGVPAGRYARRALDKAGVWKRVEGRALEGKDVTAVLLYVARGEAEAGFVYSTDALSDSKVRVVYDVPADLTGPIQYPLVTVRRERPNAGTARFVDFLCGDAAGVVFRKAGFGFVR